MIFEENQYFDLEQIEANICVYLGFAIINVVHRLFLFQIKGDSQADTTTPLTDCSSLYRQSLPHVYQLFTHLLTEQSLEPNVSVVEKKERKTRTEFSRFNSLFFPLFSREQKTFSRKARGRGSRRALIHPTYIITLYIYVFYLESYAINSISTISKLNN